MKNIKLAILLFILTTLSLYGSDRRVIVEIFTNAGCPACVAAHTALDNYLQSGNGDKIEFIFYHTEWPVPSDKLYEHNISDSKKKNKFYGPYFSSPQAFFNGQHVANSYSQWESELNRLIEEDNKFEVQLSGSKKDTSFTIKVDVTNTLDTNHSDLTINYVVVEDVHYAAANGINDHKNVMRKIVDPEGTPFDVDLNETVELISSVSINNSWKVENLKIIVFVQNQSTKEIYQSVSINFNDLVTDIKLGTKVATNFNLEQNYPNPFNPTTTINYSIPNIKGNGNFNSVKLVVYDVLGKTVATLVNKQQPTGNYEVLFDASEFTSGVYYYKLQAGKFVETKKLLLLK